MRERADGVPAGGPGRAGGRPQRDVVWPPDRVDHGGPFEPPVILDGLRDGPPVRRMRMRDGSPAWMVTGFAEARTVLADPRMSVEIARYRSGARALSPPAGQAASVARAGPRRPAPAVPPGTFIAMDPPEHRHYRLLVTGRFTVRRVRQLAPRVDEIVAAQVNRMLVAGPPADLVQALAVPVPTEVICELIGVPSAEYATVQQHVTGLLRLGARSAAAQRGGDEIRALVHRLVTAGRHGEPGDDLLSDLLHRTRPPLGDDEITGLTLLLLTAGQVDPANMLGLAAFALLGHPAQLRSLRADRTLLPGAVEELLRHQTMMHLGVVRVATEPVHLGGRRIAAGETVVVALPVANRDPARWTSPDRLDVTRRHQPHLSFGHGVHQCIGQHLGRLELSCALGQLLRRLPNLRLAVPAEEIPLCADSGIHGVQSLPVTWDPVPAERS